MRTTREDSITAARFDADRALAQSLAEDTETRRSTTTSFFSFSFSLRNFTFSRPAVVATQPPRRRAAALQPRLPPLRQPIVGKTNRTNASSAGGPGWLASLANRLFSSSTTATATTTAITRTIVVQKRLTGHNCVACQDAIRGDEVQAPCKHYYDKECILNLFDAATRDESLFPPRCCRQPIPFHSVRGLMSSKAVTRYKEKSKEFRTTRRVYCSNLACGRFLGPQLESTGWFSRRLLYCSADKCKAVTCARCKARVTFASLLRHKCNNFDRNDQAVLALGRRSGWARCPGCSQLIELSSGCYHMTCRCKTQFCYLCQARWKSCVCPQWEEQRLLLDAEDRVDARLGAAPPAARAQLSIAARVLPAAVTILMVVAVIMHVYNFFMSSRTAS